MTYFQFRPYWEYTGAELAGKDTNLQGPPRKEKTPRLAPHLSKLSLISRNFYFYETV
jgi:hypothetical protein